MEATNTNIATADQTTVVKIEEFKALISQAPTALAENKTSFSKALEKGNELIILAQKGMNDIIDAQLAAYIEKAKKTKKAMNEKRSPFTQMMTLIAKEFTSLEGGLDMPVETLQGYRDEFATKKMKERQEAERQAQLKLAKEQEAIEIERLYRIGYAASSAEYILNFKNQKTAWFNALTLDQIDSVSGIIEQLDNNLRDSQFVFDVTIPLMVQYHTVDEKVLITSKLAQSLCYGAMEDFRRSISDFKRELEDMVPSKKNQLEELERQRLDTIERQRQEAERQRIAEEAVTEARRKAAEADEANKAVLEEEARQATLKAEIERQQNDAAEKERQRIVSEQMENERQRQEAEDQRQKAEAEAAIQQAEASATVNATGQSVGAMVDTQANLFTEAPKVKEGYNIKILNPAGYLQLVSFWFENEGKNLASDKIESMTFGRIKTFCEKYAVKNDVTIESRLIEYEPVYKAK